MKSCDGVRTTHLLFQPFPATWSFALSNHPSIQEEERGGARQQLKRNDGLVGESESSLPGSWLRREYQHHHETLFPNSVKSSRFALLLLACLRWSGSTRLTQLSKQTFVRSVPVHKPLCPLSFFSCSFSTRASAFAWFDGENSLHGLPVFVHNRRCAWFRQR